MDDGRRLQPIGSQQRLQRDAKSVGDRWQIVKLDDVGGRRRGRRGSRCGRRTNRDDQTGADEYGDRRGPAERSSNSMGHSQNLVKQIRKFQTWMSTALREHSRAVHVLFGHEYSGRLAP